MVDSMDIYKSLNINFETVMKNPEMLKVVPDNLKTKKMCKHAVKKLSYLLRYVPDQYKTQQMCDKAFLENGGTLTSVADCYKNQVLEFLPQCYKTQKMCEKAVNTYPSTIKFVPKCFMTQEICEKAVNRCVFVFNSIPNQYKTQEMCNSIICEDPFSIRYISDRYKTQQMCDKAVDNCLAALKLVPDWFVISKTIKTLFTVFYADENILYLNEDSSNVIFYCNEMNILNLNINNINIDDTNYEEVDPNTIILISFLSWHIKFVKRKELKKYISEELIAIAWHPNRWWEWCLSEDEKKEIDPMFIEEFEKHASEVYNMEVLKHFDEECVGSIQ